MNEVFTLSELPPMMVLMRAGEEFDPARVEVLNMPEDAKTQLWESQLRMVAESQGQEPNIIHWRGAGDQQVIIGHDGASIPPDVRMLLAMPGQG